MACQRESNARGAPSRISRRQIIAGSTAAAVSLSSLMAQTPPAAGRKVAITIDDGPAQLGRIELWQFEHDLIKGEVLMRPILEARGKKLVWFRHPYLNTGNSPEFFREFHEFLAKRSYRVAPVTVDYKDYSYAGVWSRLMREGKKADADRVHQALIEAVDKGFEYFERESREVLGYEVAQILLIHCNELESVSLRESIAAMRKRGYSFVTLEEAMRDPAYARPDVYVGPGGSGWIRRWATMIGKAPSSGAPQMPAWISELAPPRAGRGGQGRGAQTPIQH
jgi:peptidoglycan/xylan/chitin deacetylase (PgdA/CDA1 family)